MATAPIALTGATGRIGGRVADRLATKGVPLRLLVRDPDRAPDLPDAVHVNGEPMDLAYVVGVLLANRDLERRLAAESAANAGRLAAVA